MSVFNPWAFFITMMARKLLKNKNLLYLRETMLTESIKLLRSVN